MLLAARALAEEAGNTVLSVSGAPQKGPLVRAVTPADIKDGALVISNEGDVPIDAVISVVGSAMTPEPAVSKGFTIERNYYALDGKRVDLASAAGGQATLKQNERLVVVLKVASPDTGGRILLVDRLPAGLAIENPRLVDSGDIKTLDWLKTTVKPEHTDFRDDRFVVGFDFFGSGDGRRGRRNADGDDESRDPLNSATVAYLVRAVTPGLFVHPPATVEDMYRPDRFARTASGRLEVKARE
jgi:uncharacterized protein YfaS (alpha-2-macroglobulin family)